MLLNIYSQPDGSTLDIARRLKEELKVLKGELPPDMKLAFFYDQSLLVRASVRSVWEAIIFGLVLSVLILYVFLKNWRTTFVAILVIPVTVLVTLLAMKAAGLTFNLMTLGGIAAAIGLVIDDAIVVVEAIHTKRMSGLDRLTAVREAIGEIFRPLVGSTLTPVVVFIPLAFLEGVTGVFFRALALTMVVALLTSLVLAVTLTPSLAAWLLRSRREEPGALHEDHGGRLLRRTIRVYETAVRAALGRPWLTIGACAAILLLAVVLYRGLESEFLPPMDEGGFVIDYLTPPGTSLAETHRQLQYAEDIIRSVPELESYSRRTGAQLGLFITEPNNGDFLLKLRPDRKRSTEEVLTELRHQLNAALPDVIWEFPGILGDLIGDLMYAPQPIEVKLFSTDTAYLEAKAPQVAETLGKIQGVVDVFNGLVYTGPGRQLPRPRRRRRALRADRRRHRRAPSTRPCSGRRPRPSSRATASSPSGSRPSPSASTASRSCGTCPCGRPTAAWSSCRRSSTSSRSRASSSSGATTSARTWPSRPGSRAATWAAPWPRSSATLAKDRIAARRVDRVRRPLPAAAGVVPQPGRRPAHGHLPRLHRPAPRVRLVLPSPWPSSSARSWPCSGRSWPCGSRARR